MNETIDLNADLGEDESPAAIERDIAMMDIISSCNIACGGHAGSPVTMRAMLKAAKDKTVSAGAHPSYPDRENFGRTRIVIEPSDLAISLHEQLQDLANLAAEIGTKIVHLKPHGALYNDAQDDETLAAILVDIAATENLTLVSMAQSTVHHLALERNVQFIAEAFIDRLYTPAGRLTPRTQDGAVISAQDQRVAQGLALAQGLPIRTSGNGLKLIQTDTLCLHSDSAGALTTAQIMRNALEEQDIIISAPSP
ncbi:MAG: 5-oxoprolinase subunit PxpA [Parasphingorhabdus sp.]|uniref:5-oxoprolinase subunit PxpA n=1 Tax=Parasphingorhabdus sp. TaxID=2709688 RepID=UPI0032968DCA